MMDMMKMMGKVKEVQEKMKVAQENLVHLTTTGEAGAGMVVATVNGKKELIDLKIDESLFTPDDQDMLKDLVIAAVNKAIQDIEIMAKEEIKKSTEGLMPNIPGMDLSKMF
ncbi:MAG: YbaB/EbfC family nucleoid-associated protein [Bacteroidota bacterium]